MEEPDGYGSANSLALIPSEYRKEMARGVTQIIGRSHISCDLDVWFIPDQLWFGCLVYPKSVVDLDGADQEV